MTTEREDLEAELLEEPSSVALTLAPAASIEIAAGLAQGKARASRYAAASRSANTRRTYETQWRAFTAWCGVRGLEAMPAAGSTVAIYLAELADRGRATAGISVVLTAISQGHKLAGEASPREHPAVIEVWKGIQRTLGTAQKGAAPLLSDALATAVAALPPTLTGTRDRALLLLAFAGAFRRSELVALLVDDLGFEARGLAVTLRRSKTDQEAAGRVVPIQHAPANVCAIRALQAWLTANSITTGPVFRAINRWGTLSPAHLTAHYVGAVVKAAAAAAGLTVAEFSAHSTRAGFCTSAALCGATNRQIMKITGHRRHETVDRYVRPTQLFDGLADVLGSPRR